jgi:hypothetical protein
VKSLHGKSNEKLQNYNENFLLAMKFLDFLLAFVLKNHIIPAHVADEARLDANIFGAKPSDGVSEGYYGNDEDE